jgi:hypothetical protein
MSPTPIVARMTAGLAAAAVALGVTQLAAAFFSPAADARTSVGTSVINLTPGPVKEWAIQTFGTNDKTFLTVMVVVVISALIAAAAIWERARIPLGTLALAAAATKTMTRGAAIAVFLRMLLRSKAIIQSPLL